MINVTQFRIGNYITDDDGCIAKINGFTPFDHSVRCDEPEGCILLIDVWHQLTGKWEMGREADSPECSPIILTPEWFARCGKKSDNPEWEYQIQLCALKWYFRWNTEWYSELGGIYIDSKVQCLHQIQNLYFDLTGNEFPVISP